MLLLPQRKQGLAERKRAVRMEQCRPRAHLSADGGGGGAELKKESVAAATPACSPESACSPVPGKPSQCDMATKAPAPTVRTCGVETSRRGGRGREWSVSGGAGGAQNPPHPH